MGVGFGRSDRTTRTTRPRVYSRNRGEGRGDRAVGYLLVHERGHARVRLGELLGVESLLEAGQAGHPEGLEEGGEVHALRERLLRPHVGLDEAGVHRRLLHVLEGEGAGGGLALAGELEVERAGGAHGRRRGAKGALGGGGSVAREGEECRSENDTLERVASPDARPPRPSESPNASSNRPAEFPARDGSVNLGASPARGSPRVGVGRQPRTNKRQVSSAGGRASDELVDGRHLSRLHSRLVDNTPVAEHAGVHASMARYNSFISIADANTSTPEYSHQTPFIIYDLCTDDSHPPPPPPRKGLQHALYFFPDAHGHGLLAGNAPSNDAASAFLSSGVTLS